MKLKTVIFDLDGTLVDTEAAAAAATAECFRGWGIEIGIEDAAFVTGRKWAVAFDYLFKKYTLPLPPERAAEKIMATYRKRLEEKLVIVPGSAKAVQQLAKHFSIGLVSGSNRAEILWALNKLSIQPLFQVILGAEDYGESKPNPAGYLKALQLLNARADETLVFEDSDAGIASARAAGTWVVAITATNHFSQNTSLAHEQITDFTGVDLEWTKGFVSRFNA